jgi:hypothetical protein
VQSQVGKGTLISVLLPIDLQPSDDAS